MVTLSPFLSGRKQRATTKKGKKKKRRTLVTDNGREEAVIIDLYPAVPLCVDAEVPCLVFNQMSRGRADRVTNIMQ